MSDPTLQQARRLVQALELEERMRPTWKSAQLVTLARQLVSEIEVAREGERMKRGED